MADACTEFRLSHDGQTIIGHNFDWVNPYAFILINPAGVKRHSGSMDSPYKTGQLYEVMGIACHSETKEEMIVYKGLYHCEKFGDNPWFFRPKKMFFEQVLWSGQYVPTV